jgi:hypothetical protein
MMLALVARTAFLLAGHVFLVERCFLFAKKCMSWHKKLVSCGKNWVMVHRYLEVDGILGYWGDLGVRGVWWDTPHSYWQMAGSWKFFNLVINMWFVKSVHKSFPHPVGVFCMHLDPPNCHAMAQLCV